MIDARSSFLIQGPAIISFSGGRTSAFMLHEILRAHDGKLPPDVHVSFANTGKEREETLRFVHECGSRWGVRIHWLEWRAGKPCFEEVGFNSASRKGEPFEALILKKNRLPNWMERFCTQYLKVKPLQAFAASMGLKHGQYAEVIGLRDDEPERVLRALYNAEWVKKKNGPDQPRKPHLRIALPLAKAKVAKADVMRFWLGDNADPIMLSHPLPQGFDLGLRDHEGNCDLCFMKARATRKRIIRDVPGVAMWWDRLERRSDQFFDRRDRVRELVDEVRRSPAFDDEFDPSDYDAECGLICGADA
jgi:3'-phosphoadenosine 5'-phosphosulfate sulfotransferase (PAPS reductase)/FAD synthetase